MVTKMRLHEELLTMSPKYASMGEVILDDYTVIDLSNLDLTDWPESLFSLSQVRVLDVSGNKLTSVHPDVAKLDSLRALYLSDNYIRRIPEFISSMPLDMLSISNNPLTTVPGALRRMSATIHSDQYHGRACDMPEWRPGFSVTSFVIALFLWVFVTPVYTIGSIFGPVGGFILAIVWFWTVPFLAFKLSHIVHGVDNGRG